MNTKRGLKELAPLFLRFMYIGITGDYRSYQKRLSDDLLSKYGSTALRPVKNISQPVNVSFRILVRQVIDFVSKSFSFIHHLFLFLRAETGVNEGYRTHNSSS